MDNCTESKVRLIISTLRLSASELHGLQFETGNTLNDIGRLGDAGAYISSVADELTMKLIDE